MLGVVTVGVEADQQPFQFYSTGVITSGCGAQVDLLRHPLHVPFPPQACICARVSPAPHLCDSG